MLPVRLYFEKTGRAIYTSHLDLVRCFERCLRRADIPFWFTEGFNPRPFMSFALPLSLGVTGLREVIDIRLVEDMPLDEVIERLNKVLPEGLKILSAGEPVKKVTDIASSDYEITIIPENGAQLLGEKLNEFLSQESIVTQKKNKKKKLVDVELKPHIRSYNVNIKEDAVILETVLASGTSENCNPSLVLGEFWKYAAIEEAENKIVRKRILDTDGKEFA